MAKIQISQTKLNLQLNFIFMRYFRNNRTRWRIKPSFGALLKHKAVGDSDTHHVADTHKEQHHAEWFSLWKQVRGAVVQKHTRFRDVHVHLVCLCLRRNRQKSEIWLNTSWMIRPDSLQHYRSSLLGVPIGPFSVCDDVLALNYRKPLNNAVVCNKTTEGVTVNLTLFSLQLT